MARKPKKTVKLKTIENTLADMYREGIGNMAEMNTTMMDSLGDMSAQLAKFFAQRVEEDVKVQHDLLQCKTLNEVQHVQLQFLETAYKQYQENTAKMMDIGTQALGAK